MTSLFGLLHRGNGHDTLFYICALYIRWLNTDDSAVWPDGEMADDAMVVPVLLLDGSTEYPAISPSATAQNLVDILTRLESVKETIPSDVPSSAWALQRVRKEKAGRRWDSAELDALDNGIISSTTTIKTFLKDTDPKLPVYEEKPALRLVSLHFPLSLSLAFLRVPEVHDGFQWTVFFGMHTTVGDVINNVVEELGLVRRVPTSKQAETVEYALEQSIGNSNVTPLAPFARMVEVLQKKLATFPGEAPVYHFCIPELWFLRPKPRPPSMQSLSGASGSVKMEASTEIEDGNTAKQKKSIAETPSSRPVSSEWRSSIAQNRLTNFFPSWAQPAPATTSTVIASANRRSISEPLLMEQNTGGNFPMSPGVIDDADEGWNDIEAEELERCLDQLGLTNDARANVYQQSSEKKRQLIQEVQRTRILSSEKASTPGSTTSIPSRLPRLLPQFSGDSGIFRRLSTFSTWGSTSSPLPQPTGDGKGFSSGFESDTSPEPSASGQSQTTGGVFSSLWAILGGEPMTGTDNDASARAYVDGLRKARSLDAKLVNYLISLRVHLSTAKLEWIESFLAEQGMAAITDLLSSLTGKPGKRRVLTDGESSVLLELIRCLRVLLNTRPGFNSALITPVVTSHLVYFIFHGAPLRSRILAAELLAALCVLSLDEGHPSVLASFSEYRLTHNEVFRFQSLVDALKVPNSQLMEQSATILTEDDGIWEGRIAFMALINAITNRPNSLDERIVLRDEFTRRGLNEVIVGLRYSSPPEGLLTQLNIYVEEKFEDEEEFRERTRRGVQADRGHSSEELEPAFLLKSVLESAKVLESTKIVENLLRRLDQLMKENVNPPFKRDALSILDDLVGYLVAMKDTGDAWLTFVDNVTTSIQKVTGVDARTRYAKDIQVLRDRVDSLLRQNAALKGERQQPKSEDTSVSRVTAQPLSKLASPSKASNEKIAGIIQRLSQKEKEVGQLQAEIERLKRQTIRPDDHNVRTERDKTKISSLSEEVEKLKAKIGQFDGTLFDKEKEIVDLKCALKSVYSSFCPEGDEGLSGLNAQAIADRTVEKFNKQAGEIATLQVRVAELLKALVEKSTKLSELQFKVNNSPPSPPADSRNVTLSKSRKAELIQVRKNSEDASQSSPSSPPPPPPPPPPSLVSFSRNQIASALTHGIRKAEALENDTSIASQSFPPVPPPVGSVCPPPPPPPPLPPGIPPPPPLPPARGPGGKSQPKPNLNGPRLKPFFWNKLDGNVISSTVWAEPRPGFQLNTDDLVATFGVDITPTPSQLMNPSRKKNVTTVLDISRANNIAIMLSRFKNNYSTIRCALLDLDSSRLSIDDLRAISKHLPTSEEIARIRDFGDVTKLAKSDQYFSEIITIPRLAQRLECMIFRLRFELDVSEIRPDLKTIRDACKELRSSARFKTALQAILTIGNALNQSTFRGGAHGFRLEALLKMKDTKTVKSGADCPTLLHYISRVFIRADPKLTLFMEELPSVEAAARVSFQAVIQSVQSVVTLHAKGQEEVRIIKRLPDPPSNDQFVRVMEPFLGQISERVDALKQLAQTVENDLRSLYAYFGESFDTPESPKPEDFFGMICSFSLSLQKAAVEVHNSASKQALTPAVLQEKEMRSEPSTAGGQNASELLPPLSNSEEKRATLGRGEVDETIRMLKEGTFRNHARNGPLDANKIFVDGRTDV